MSFYFNRGTARHLQGDLLGAIADFDQAVAINAGCAAAYNNRGLTRQLSGDLVGALADFDRAIAIDPGYAEAHSNRGVLRHAQGEASCALADFDRAVTINPLYAEAHNNRGVTLQAQGDLVSAIRCFDRALTLNPGYAEAYSNRGAARHALAMLSPGAFPQAFHDRIVSGVERTDLSNAIADFDRALELTPTRFAAVIYHNRGAARQAQGDTAGALADFDRAIAIDPSHVPTYANRGTARKARGDLAGAIEDFNLAIEQTPRHAAAPIYHNRGGACILMNDFAGAIADYDQALEIDPELLVAHISRGNARYHARDPLAFTDYLHVLRVNAPLAAREILGMLVDDLHHDAAAVLKNCNKHLRINPNDITALCRRGLTRILMGEPLEELRADFERVFRLRPDVESVIQPLISGAMERSRSFILSCTAGF